MNGPSPTHDSDGTSREVAEGVYRFGTRRINWYVLKGDAGLTVVDAGLPGHRTQLGDWLEENGFTLADVRALVLTHADADHVGFATDLADRGVPVYCHPADLPLLRGHPHGPPGWFLRNLWRPGFLPYAIEMVRDGIRTVEPIDEAEPLADEDVLSVPGGPRVLFTPGHTPGSCALYVDDRDILFTGDALVTRNIFTGREGDPQLLGEADEDTDEALRSLSHLEGLGAVTILPGHGDPWEGDIDAAVDMAR